MFKTFPEFTKLTLEHKDEYEAFISQYPPFSEYSFATIMTWWDALDSAAVSVLNGNLIISCWLPGDEDSSGLMLVGKQSIDETVCAIFDCLQARGEVAKLVHVPEFVISSMRYPEFFKLTPERDYDECIVPISGLYPLSEATDRLRWGVDKFLARMRGSHIVAKSLDLRNPANQQLLLDRSAQWPQKGDINNTTSLEQEMMPLKVKQAGLLSIGNICIYIDDELAGFFLYQMPHDKRYVIASYARLNASIPRIFEYMVYTYAKHFADQGITYINLDFDMGLPVLRAAKLGLGPMNFFRKYTVQSLKDVHTVDFASILNARP